MSSTVFEILIVLLLIVANGVFAMSEMAIVTSRKTRLQQLAKEGSTGARAALDLAESPNRFFSTVQIGITLIGIFAGAFGGATLAEKLSVVLEQVTWLEPYSDGLAFGLVVGAITFLSLVLGELVPKRVALGNPEQIAIAVAASMGWLSRLASPVVRVLSASTELGLRVLGVKATNDPVVTAEEIRSLINQGTEDGTIESTEQELLDRVFSFGDRQVASIMTPRPDIAWIDINDSPEAIRAELKTLVHSRFPVCRGELDRVLGIVQVKDLLGRALSEAPLDLQANLHQPLFVPETAPASEVLDRFRQSGVHLALVVDEFGSVQGLVTQVDVLEALVGDLAGNNATTDAPVVRREDGSYLVDGSLSLDELEHLVEELPGLPRGRYRTVGGFVMARLGRIPAVTDGFHWSGFSFEILDMDGNRVDKVLVKPDSTTTRNPA